MSFKQFDFADLGTITVYKRRGNRNIRLSVSPAGEIRLTLPRWASYSAGLAFAESKKGWILSQKGKCLAQLTDGQLIGKAHRLKFTASQAVNNTTSRIVQDEINVIYPVNLHVGHPHVQKAAVDGGIRALRRQAEKLLPLRLNELAAAHGLSYQSVRIKKLKSRWGSCDQDANIVLNLYLMQLPWNLIDYVILHELTHTKVLRHGPPFWSQMQQYNPRAKEYKKALRAFQPTLGLI